MFVPDHSAAALTMRMTTTPMTTPMTTTTLTTTMIPTTETTTVSTAMGLEQRAWRILAELLDMDQRRRNADVKTAVFRQLGDDFRQKVNELDRKLDDLLDIEHLKGSPHSGSEQPRIGM